VRRLWESPTLRSMVVYGASGVGFAGANLILARVLPTEQYALFTLFIALGNLGYSLGPAGIDGVVNRRHLAAGPALLASLWPSCVLVGLAFAVAGMVVYDMSFPLAAMLFVSSTFGGGMMVAGATFQSEHRFGVSLTLLQSPNIILILAALVTVAAHVTQAWLPALISTIGFVAAAAYGWTGLLAERHHKPHRDSAFSWGEALSFAGLNASGLVLIQMERLVIPHLLPLSQLALYGVLGAIAGSLFRVLQMGVGFSLLPRLRAAATVPERRRLIAQEARLVGAIALLGAVTIWFVTPVAEHLFLAGKYHLPGSLVVAAIVSGIAKIANAFTKAAASALAEPRELSWVNMVGWVSVGIALVAAFAGARWGLAGIIYGVGFGWIVRAVVAFALIMRHLRLPVSVPVTAP
jgi:O-antigen/teichoic acid export membrane protein